MKNDLTLWTNNKKISNAPKFAGFWIRFGAFIIDAIIGGIVGLIFSIPFESLSTSSDRALGVFMGFFIFLIKALFQANRGQSIGQSVFKLGVAGTKKRNYFDALLRNSVALILMAIPFLNAINALITGVSDKKQGLHDRAAKTWVVKL
jgi:uncharacterized RDD family membrane protein YckC